MSTMQQGLKNENNGGDPSNPENLLPGQIGFYTKMSQELILTDLNIAEGPPFRERQLKKMRLKTKV